jgi:site-specific recombinase XerD
MATDAIIPSASDPFGIQLVPNGAGKDVKHRLVQFEKWLADNGLAWHMPELKVYRDYLLGRGLVAASVQAHLATIRGRYTALLRNNIVRQALYDQVPHDTSAADRKAFVDEYLQRLKNAIDPDNARVQLITRQDRPDSEGRRLTTEQANTLLRAPMNHRDSTPLMVFRDTAILALMLCTGIREAELCALDVADLRQHYGGELALHIRQGKGAKERLVPYGALDFALAVTEKWLSAAGITSGAVFRGFYKGSKRVRAGRLTVRAINQILDHYPIVIDGEQTAVNPHDLRRTYARRLYEAGVNLLSIQQNLGHADHKTTEKYIGKLDASARRPPALYHFDLGRLNRV